METHPMKTNSSRIDFISAFHKTWMKPEARTSPSGNISMIAPVYEKSGGRSRIVFAKAKGYNFPSRLEDTAFAIRSSRRVPKAWN
jgi:hypothetical protein